MNYLLLSQSEVHYFCFTNLKTHLLLSYSKYRLKAPFGYYDGLVPYH